MIPFGAVPEKSSKNVMGNKFEQKEAVLEVRTLTAQELKDLIYNKEEHDIDPRFRNPDRGGVFHYFDPRHNLFNSYREHQNIFYPVVFVDGKIVAIAEIQKSPRKGEENIYWIEGVSVDPEYQDSGYGSMVLEETFKFIQEKNGEILASYYSKDGLNKLKSVCHRLAEKYDVKFRESDHQIHS